MKQRSIQNFGNYFLEKLWSILLFCLLAISISAQDLPDKIRGYKVYRAEISVKTVADKSQIKSKTEAFVKVGEPELINVSLSGITFEISAEIDALEQSGKVDFLTFNDFRVNGLAVEVEVYKNSFEFRKNQLILLPKPARIFLGISQTLRGALKEWQNSKDEWQVTGKIFVFGKFKKYGFSFKHVIPVEINLKIKNPLREISSK